MPTIAKLVMCGLACSLAGAAIARAQTPFAISRVDSLRLGQILAEFHRDRVVDKGKCKPAACRHSVVYGPMAQSLGPFVAANLAGLPSVAEGTDSAVPYFGLRVRGLSQRADTLVVSVDAIHRMANSVAWSEWETSLLVTRDRKGSLVLSAQRLVRITDVVPP